MFLIEYVAHLICACITTTKKESVVIYTTLSLLASLACLSFRVIDLDHFKNKCERKLQQPNENGGLSRYLLEISFHIVMFVEEFQ
ncbi:hypothetical protein BWR16_13760 [Vibrio sp. V01_P9A10T6]|nr:hypothetical protein BWR16_13760 [Vibrio sp. V01_P9A10T6]